jgi:hypothetical protein
MLGLKFNGSITAIGTNLLTKEKCIAVLGVTSQNIVTATLTSISQAIDDSDPEDTKNVGKIYKHQWKGFLHDLGIAYCSKRCTECSTPRHDGSKGYRCLGCKFKGDYFDDEWGVCIDCHLEWETYPEKCESRTFFMEIHDMNSDNFMGESLLKSR